MRFLSLLLLISCCSHAQPKTYTTANAHSHNDYEQQSPFWEAYNHGFGSIEADIFLVEGENQLLVAHSAKELKMKKRTLDSLYLQPLVNCLQKNHGFPYADTSKYLQILVDIKTEATATLKKLVATLQQHPQLTFCKKLRFVISGNRPAPDSFVLCPSFIYFDGELDKTYSAQALSRISLMSDNLKHYAIWNEKDSLSESEKQKLVEQINKTHRLNKPVRFWNAPDDKDAWLILMNMGVDFINTDHIEALSRFLSIPPESNRK
jgi:alkaline phosphatase